MRIENRYVKLCFLNDFITRLIMLFGNLVQINKIIVFICPNSWYYSSKKSIVIYDKKHLDLRGIFVYWRRLHYIFLYAIQMKIKRSNFSTIQICYRSVKSISCIIFKLFSLSEIIFIFSKGA